MPIVNNAFSNQLFSKLRVYKNSSYTDLFLKFSCYKVFQFPVFVLNMEKLYNISNKTLGENITSLFVKKTVGRSFIGGENNYQMSLKVNELNQKDDLPTIISVCIEAEEHKEILPQEMDKIRDFYIESAQILNSLQKKNMIAVKLSPLCHYKTLLKLNQNQKFLQELVQHDITVIEFKQILLNYNIQFSDTQLQDFLKNILQTESDIISHLNWQNFMHAYYVDESKNQDFIVQQLSPLTNEESQYAFQFYNRLNLIVNEIYIHDLQGVFDAEQSIFQYQIWSINIQLQNIYNKEKPILSQTIQNYLADSYKLVNFEIERQKKFGTVMAIKMVRGAYMVFESQYAKQNNTKYPICSSIEETSEMMNGNIVQLIQNIGDKGQIIIASHNEYTNYEMTKYLTNDQLKNQVIFAHLLGLGDNLSFLLKNQGYAVMKYVPYGTVNQMMPYLIRRAQEACSILSTVHIINDAIKQEVRYRLKN